MNYLIVIPRFVDKVGEWYFFPLGIPYVSASMKANGLKPVTLNLNNEHGLVEDILRKFICDNNIDVVLTGGLSVQYNSIKEVIHFSKTINPQIITIVGGGIITSRPEVGMESLGEVDYGIIGEGEITTCELCRAINEKTNVVNVKGIIYWEETKTNYVITEKRKELENIDNIPVPDYDGFKFEENLDLVPSMSAVNQPRTLVILGSRSCPFHCTFCFHPSGSKYRQRSIESFFNELEFLVNKYDIKHIFIADELFAYDKKRVQEFCSRIKKLNIPWYACFRVSDVTEELVEILKDGNCHTMAVGLESADNKILKSMKKFTTVEEIEKALKIIDEAGITIQGNFIFGDVEETIETATNTLNWWEKHPQYAIILNFIVTYPGTPLYEYACEVGIIKDEVQFIKDGCPAINISKMSDSEISWLSEQIMRSSQDIIRIPDKISEEAVDENRKSISFVGYCIHCGAKNSWSNIRLFLRNQLSCAKCGGKHRVPIIKLAENYIDRNIVNLLKKHNRLAFWGLPDYFIDLVDMLEVMADTEIYFIDTSKLKQTWTLRGKTIHSPKVINDKNIPLVVVGATGYFAMIADQIRAEYKNTECLNILELLRSNDIKLQEE